MDLIVASNFSDFDQLDEANSRNNMSDATRNGFEEFAQYFAFIVEGIAILLVGAIGVGINLVALGILFRKRVMRNFHSLMCSLAVYDLLHNIFDILCFSLPHFSQDYKDKFLLHAIPYVIPLTQISLTGSCYTTVAITVERFLAVKSPFFIQRHNIKARQFILPVVIYAILYNIPRFFEFAVEEQSCHEANQHQLKNDSSVDDDFGDSNVTLASLGSCVPSYLLQLTEMRKNSMYISIYVNSLTFIFNSLLPLLTMSVMNYIVYRTIHHRHQDDTESLSGGLGRRHFVSSRSYRERNQQRHSSSGFVVSSSHTSNVIRKREVRITRACIAITLMFVICNTPRCVPNLMEIFMSPEDFPKWLPILINTNHFLITVNSAFNFLFYLSYCKVKRKGNLAHNGLACFNANQTGLGATEWEEFVELHLSHLAYTPGMSTSGRSNSTAFQRRSHPSIFTSGVSRRPSREPSSCPFVSSRLSVNRRSSGFSNPTPSRRSSSNDNRIQVDLTSGLKIPQNSLSPFYQGPTNMSRHSSAKNMESEEAKDSAKNHVIPNLTVARIEHVEPARSDSVENVGIQLTKSLQILNQFDLVEECINGQHENGVLRFSKSTSILNWETSLVNGEGAAMGDSKKSLLKKISSSFSAQDFPVKSDGQKLLHSVSSLRITKETSFITISKKKQSKSKTCNDNSW